MKKVSEEAFLYQLCLSDEEFEKQVREPFFSLLLETLEETEQMDIDDVNQKIDRLCESVNVRMDWMRLGVTVAWFPAMISLLLAVYCVWRLHS